MNRLEERILHGLYYNRETVDEEVPYAPAELNWLANTRIPGGRHWQGKDGKLKSLAAHDEDWLVSVSNTSAAVARPLAYLRAAGHIAYSKDEQWFRIAVTHEGADLARALDTFWGRRNVSYKRHKDGVLWFLATVSVSALTTVITQCAS
jgi:hypothetical protein